MNRQEQQPRVPLTFAAAMAFYDRIRHGDPEYIELHAFSEAGITRSRIELLSAFEDRAPYSFVGGDRVPLALYKCAGVVAPLETLLRQKVVGYEAAVGRALETALLDNLAPAHSSIAAAAAKRRAREAKRCNSATRHPSPLSVALLELLIADEHRSERWINTRALPLAQRVAAALLMPLRSAIPELNEVVVESFLQRLDCEPLAEVMEGPVLERLLPAAIREARVILGLPDAYHSSLSRHVSTTISSTKSPNPQRRAAIEATLREAPLPSGKRYVPLPLVLPESIGEIKTLAEAHGVYLEHRLRYLSKFDAGFVRQTREELFLALFSVISRTAATDWRPQTTEFGPFVQYGVSSGLDAHLAAVTAYPDLLHQAIVNAYVEFRTPNELNKEQKVYEELVADGSIPPDPDREM